MKHILITMGITASCILSACAPHIQIYDVKMNGTNLEVVIMPTNNRGDAGGECILLESSRSLTRKAVEQLTSTQLATITPQSGMSVLADTYDYTRLQNGYYFFSIDLTKLRIDKKKHHYALFIYGRNVVSYWRIDRILR